MVSLTPRVVSAFCAPIVSNMSHAHSDRKADAGTRGRDAAARARLEADLRLTMAQRLAKANDLCRQATMIAGAARRA